MSRIGKAPIVLPKGVTVTLQEGNIVTVKGPKGELTRTVPPAMLLKQDMRSLPFLMAAQVFAVLGVLLFLVSVVTVWRRSARPVAA